MAPVKKLTVVLEDRDDKKSSVKFATEKDGVNPDNIYIPNDGMKKLGDCPNGVKVTVEPA